MLSSETSSRKQSGLLFPSIDHSYSNFREDANYSPGNYNNNNNNFNNNNITKHGQRNAPLTHQGSLSSADVSVVASQSLLAPPNLYPKERRHSTSSCDSSTSQVSKRRLSRHSSSRLSDFDFDDDNKEITLLSVGRGVGGACRRLCTGLRRTVGVLFVSRPKRPQIVCEAEVMEQVSWVATSCVVSRLTTRQLMNRKIVLALSDWHRSVHVVHASFALENIYPKVYSNVSRKLCMTMNSQKVVTTTLCAIFKVLFEDSISWGKIVSMLTVAGLFAEECACQGHEEFVKDVVDTVVDFTGVHLLSWLMAQGGWEAFPIPEISDRSRLSKCRLLILAGITTVVVMATSVFFDLWRLS